MSWDDNSDDETGFDIYQDGKLVSVVKENVVTANICGGMKPATEYRIAVTAKNSAGASLPVIGYVTTKDITTAPKAPSGLKVSAIDKTSARLVWQDNAWDESAYDVYVNGKWLKSIKADSTSTVITGLKAGTAYAFQVTAKNKIGGTPSEVIDAVTESEPIIDTVAPTLTLLGESSVNLIVGDVYNDAGATAVDDIDGNVSANITTLSTVDTNTTGAYTVTYSVSDSAGNLAKISRSVQVKNAESLHAKANIPYDSNLELDHEKGFVYYVDPRPEENGLNRAIKIDYLNWSFEDLNVSGNNPHSLDRAGDSDKFYVRTQNSHSFDVINFKTKEVKSVDMGEHKPRAIGATNLKHHLQLISVKNRQVIDVIDTTTDSIIAHLGDEAETPGVGTGHALWFDDDHFGLIDRKAPQIVIYKVVPQGGSFNFVETDRVPTRTSLHAIERVSHPKTRADLVAFYGNGEGNIAKGGDKVPYIQAYTFDPVAGKLIEGIRTDLVQSNAVVQGRPPVTHHAGVSPDGKYYVAPVFDGHVYIIDRSTMQVVKVLNASLGAAHYEFSKSLNYAIITNHWSNELTIIDLTTLTVKKRITISTTQHYDQAHPHLLQPHFSYLSEDGKKYYTFATQDGDFLEINLETFTVDRKLHVGGAPEQAHS